MQAMSKMFVPTGNVPSNRGNQAKAVRTQEEMTTPAIINPDVSAEVPQPGFQVQDTEPPATEVPGWPSYGRQDHVKILKLAEKKQLSLLECGGHQITKELDCESNQSVIHLTIYADYLRQKGHDVDQRMLAKSLKAKRSVIVYLKDKERRANQS